MVTCLDCSGCARKINEVSGELSRVGNVAVGSVV